MIKRQKLKAHPHPKFSHAQLHSHLLHLSPHPHPQVARAGLGIGVSQYNSSLQLLPPCTFPLLHCWSSTGCSSFKKYPTGPMWMQGWISAGFTGGRVNVCSRVVSSTTCSAAWSACSSPSLPLLFVLAVSHSSTCPAFLLFLKYVFTEAPQTSLMCSSLARGGSVAELAVPTTGQPLTSSHRCLPCSPPQLLKPCHGNPVQWAISSGTIRPEYFGSTSEMACRY